MVEEHLHYYSQADILETAGVTYVENSETDILYGGSPEKAPSADLVNYYIKVRIYNPPVVDPANPPKKYNGEFGFDWIDVDPSSEEVQKIQDVDFSNVEYFYKKGATANDLGDIIAKSADEQGAKDAITASYRLSECPKPCKDGKIDMPFVLMKPGQEISLSLEVALTSGVLNNEKIYLEGNDCYSFELVGGTKTGNKTEKIIADKEIIVLKIKCLKESPEITFKIKQENPTQKLETVGGFIMMENKVLKLKFRVIALVANEPAASAKAQALFQKFKDNKVKEYLNENSLNQAGYEVEIENQAMFDTLGSGDLDDYFYAFDKTDWTNKKYFAAGHSKKKKKWEYVKKADGSYEMESDGVTYKKKLVEYQESLDVIVDNSKHIGGTDTNNNIDDITIKVYKDKLKGKGKIYEGGIIILCDFESSDLSTGAYSRTSPLNHYALIVYYSNTGSKDTYAHEIGHMLGLDHLFYDSKELTSFSNSKSYYKTLKTNLSNKTKESYPFYTYKQVRAKILTLKKSLNNFIANQQKYITDKEKNIIQGKASNGTFTYNGKTVTKQEYISLVQKDIEKQKIYINENKEALKALETSSIKDFEEFKANFNILKNDSIKLDKEFIEMYEKEWKQIESNYIRFKKGTTKNIMDYDITRLSFLHHQITIMRDDIKNY